MTKLKNPSHPGEVLKELYLKPLNLSEGKLAKYLGVPRTRIERLTKLTTAVTPDTAMRLSKFFGTTPQYWMNMQTNFDMARAEVDIDVSDIQPLVMA